MTMIASRGIDTYRKTQIQTSSPAELVVMLYDGALRFSADARAAIERGDVAAKGVAISKVLAIVGELRGTLDMDAGGELAISLERLYDFISAKLMDASFRKDVAPLDEAVKVLANLREGWAEAAAQKQAAA